MAFDREWRQAAGKEIPQGWPILCGATLGIAVGAAALPFCTAGQFVMPLQQTFGWTRSQLLARTFIIVLCALLAGMTVDRLGVRMPAAFSLLALAGSFMALGAINGKFWIYVAIQLAFISLALILIGTAPASVSKAAGEGG